MSIKSIHDYADAGYRVFPLHNLLPGGKCGCGNPECKSGGKHPAVNNWQNSPKTIDNKSIEQIEGGTGYGVVIDSGTLVIDIDPRNGGNLSYNRLSVDLGIDFKGAAGLVVRTGGGGWHLYFRTNGGALKGKLSDYKGIDFKSSGYVVGPGSIHSTGAEYEIERGAPGDETMAPDALLELLKKPDVFRGESDGHAVDVDEAQLIAMVNAIDPDSDYETWVQIGMAIHLVTDGAGESIFDEWSAKGSKYPGSSSIHSKWHSFGEHADPVTLGTIIHHALEAGYQFPVENHGFAWADSYNADDGRKEVKESLSTAFDPDVPPFDVSGVDIESPPGFVGDLARWINANSRYPRKHLAVAGALVSVGNIAGMRYTDAGDSDANLFAFCVSGSGTGKEAIQGSVTEIHKAAGVGQAVVGNVKSEQEIVRNLIRNQAAYYVVDEFGYLLAKIANAQAKGSAAYLEGVISTMMSAYSKTHGTMLISGDLKKETEKDILNSIAIINKRVETGSLSDADAEKMRASSERMLEMIKIGIEKPFLSVMGFSTPVSFDGLVTAEQATNGFIARSLIFIEKNTNPRAVKGWKKVPMSMAMQMRLINLRHGNDPTDTQQYRIEYCGERKVIPTSPAAGIMLDQVIDWFHEYSEMHVTATGLEAISRRAYELVAKVALILGIPGGRIEEEHVRWAYVIVRRDIEGKMHLANANRLSGSKDSGDRASALGSKILGKCSVHEDTKRGQLINKCKSKEFSKGDVENMIDALVKSGNLKEYVRTSSTNSREFKSYRLCQ